MHIALDIILVPRAMPVGVSELFFFVRNQDVHQYNTRQRSNPRVNKWSKAISKRAFVYMGTHLWSKVARDLQNIVNTKIFVKRYKKLLLEKY